VAFDYDRSPQGIAMQVPLVAGTFGGIKKSAPEGGLLVGEVKAERLRTYWQNGQVRNYYEHRLSTWGQTTGEGIVVVMKEEPWYLQAEALVSPHTFNEGFSTWEHDRQVSRIYRIFEGTNEINRTIIPSTLLKRAAKGDLSLQDSIDTLKTAIATGEITRDGEEGIVQAAKDIFLLTLDASQQKYGKDLAKHQEIIGRLAELSMQAYAMDSAWLRAQKAVANEGEAKAKHKLNMATAYINSTVGLLEYTAKETLTALAEGEELAKLLEDLKKLTQYSLRNTVSLRQEIAAVISENGKYTA
jgi:hypothetical protein